MIAAEEDLLNPHTQERSRWLAGAGFRADNAGLEGTWIQAQTRFVSVTVR